PCPARSRLRARAIAPTAARRRIVRSPVVPGRIVPSCAEVRRAAPSSSSCVHPVESSAAPRSRAGPTRLGLRGAGYPAGFVPSSAMRPRAPRLGTGKVTHYRHRSRFQTRSHRLRAAAIGLGETLGPIAEKIDLAPTEREQALFRRGVRFDRAVGANVTKREPAFAERSADQQTAMAVERLALGTQETDALARARIHDAREPGGKFWPRGHGLVVGNPVTIKRRIARAAAERVAQRETGDAL